MPALEHDARGLGGAFITEIYAALLGNGSWQSFLDRLSGILPNCKPHLFSKISILRLGHSRLLRNSNKIKLLRTINITTAKTRMCLRYLPCQ